MSRPSNEEKQTRARQSLIKALTKIYDLEPTLGGKWRDGMVTYYENRLAWLILHQLGFNRPSEQAIKTLTNQIHTVLVSELEVAE